MDFSNLIIFKIPLLLLKPFWGFIKQLYYEFWSVFRNAIDFMQKNPIVVLLIEIIAILIAQKM